jgi:hypothetical protein
VATQRPPERFRNSDPSTGDEWRPGEEWVLKESDPNDSTAFGEDDQVLVLWTTPDGSSSQILANGDLP